MTGLVAYKVGTRWYLFRGENDYPDKPFFSKGFPSRKEALKYLAEHTHKGTPS